MSNKQVVSAIVGLSVGIGATLYFNPFNIGKSLKEDIATTKQEITDCEESAKAIEPVFKADPNMKRATSIEGSFCKKQMEYLYK
jgi:hypothetical protein